jgi:hypothetical protein
MPGFTRAATLLKDKKPFEEPGQVGVAIPVFNILEAAGFDLVVANARQIKAVPGRKTDG